MLLQSEGIIAGERTPLYGAFKIGDSKWLVLFEKPHVYLLNPGLRYGNHSALK